MNYDLLNKKLQDEINTNLKLFLKFKIKNEKDFHKNKEAIAFSIHTVRSLAELLKDVNNSLLALRGEKGDTLIAIKEYAKNLVSKFGTVNTHKLYDFMTLDLPNLSKEI